MASPVKDAVISAGGWIVALATVLISAVVQWRKGSVDETGMVLGKWKELVDAHQSQISTLHQRIEQLLRENMEFRDRLDAAEKRIRELEQENTGLRRAIIQNSRSAGRYIELGGRNLEQDDIEGTQQ